MTKDVLVSVKGTQFLDEESDTIEIIMPGTYYKKNGRHYILYDESMEEVEMVTHNTVKAAQDKIEVLKHGIVETHMVFQPGKKTMANYLTPIGLIVLGLTTASITVEEQENAIHINVDYALEMNGEHVSNCFLGLDVHSKQEGALCLHPEKE